MFRFCPALIAATLIAFPCEAASLVHPSAASSAVVKGVTVWRGPAPRAAETPVIKTGADTCRSKTVVHFTTGWPRRGLRTHGFWSGDGLTSDTRRARGRTTQGFYADRMEGGL